jgi:hypothetical protein
MPYHYKKTTAVFIWFNTRKKRILAAIIFGLFLGIFSRTLHDIYVDYRSAKGLIAASGRPVGGDFICFYLAGQTAVKDPSRLYDWEDAVKRQRALLNAPDGKEWILPYAYPPPFALLLIPFGKLAFLPANLAWIGFSLSLAFLSVFLVLSQSWLDRRQRIYASLSLLAFTPFTLDCLAGGQTSAIGMLIVAGVYSLTKKRREFAAGLVLGLGYYKPPLFVFLALAFLLQRRWRVIGGALLSGLALVLLSVIYLGPSGFMDYLEKMSRYLYGREVLPGLFLPAGKAVGLLSFLLSNLSGKNAMAWSLYLVFLALALLFYFKALSRMNPRAEKNRAYDILYSLGVTLSLLFSVQMCKYDISILFIAILVAAETVTRLQNKLVGLIGFALILFLFLTPLINQIEFPGIVIKPIMLLMVSWSIYLFYLLNNKFIVQNRLL